VLWGTRYQKKKNQVKGKIVHKHLWRRPQRHGAPHRKPDQLKRENSYNLRCFRKGFFDEEVKIQ